MIPVYRYLEVGLYSVLNLMPFMLLAMYPFRRHLRFSTLVTRLLLVALAVGQFFLGCVAAFSPVGSEVLSLFSTVIYAAFYFFVIKHHIGCLSFVLLVFSNLGNLVSVCAKCIEGMIFGDIALEPYRWTMCVCMLMMHVVVTVPVGFYIRKFFTGETPIQTRSWRYLWIIPATFYAIWYYHLYFSGQSALMVALDPYHAVFLLLINLGAFVVYHTSVLLLFAQQETAQLAHDNHLLSISTIQHENLQQRINEARQAKHDVRHHAYLMREYLRNGQLQELEAYLDKYCSSLPETRSLMHCQHDTTNVLLSYFAQQAADRKINMDIFVQLPKTIHLPETTISVVLGNLLENAIDACSKVTSGQKKITVRGKASMGSVFFEITNTYDGNLRKTKSGAFLSTKKGSGHGLGLESVSQLAESLGGILELDAKDGVFRASILLLEAKQ